MAARFSKEAGIYREWAVPLESGGCSGGRRKSPRAMEDATDKSQSGGPVPTPLVLCQSLKLGFTDLKLGFTVIPAQAGIQIAALVSRLRGNDVTQKLRFDKALVVFSVIDEGV
ncbi:MAG: hypothetical protein WCK86_05440 [Planctomycetia bacterium]